jgi:hypothetical protein
MSKQSNKSENGEIVKMPSFRSSFRQICFCFCSDHSKKIRNEKPNHIESTCLQLLYMFKRNYVSAMEEAYFIILIFFASIIVRLLI